LAGASSDGLEEAVDGDPYGVQRQAWRRPVPACSTAGVVAVPGVALQGRDGRTGPTVAGMALPPARRHGLTLQIHEGKVRGCSRPPFESAAR
jgi:hypothetical protein